jgi:hypothetical protein
MKKKFILFAGMVVVLSYFSYANVCNSDYGHDFDLEPALRKGLRLSMFAYLANPKRMENMDKDMLSDAVDFYFQAAGSVDCNAVMGSQSGQQMYIVLEHVLVEQIPSEENGIKFPTCEDGTPYGECSHKKPLFCMGGELIPLCMGPDRIGLRTGPISSEHWVSDTVNDDNCGCPDDHGDAVFGADTARYCDMTVNTSLYGTCTRTLTPCTDNSPCNTAIFPVTPLTETCIDGNGHTYVYSERCIEGF